MNNTRPDKTFTAAEMYDKPCSIDLSVVVLCYHSGKSILHLYDELNGALQRMGIDYEIILVANDFAESRDETMEIVKDISRKNARVNPITKIKKGMMGWDMLQGLNAAKGNYICVVDGDGQFPMGIIPEAYKQMIDAKIDVIKTYRIERGDGIYRALLSKTYNILFNIMFPGLKSKDVNSKPKIISRSAYKQMNLQSTDWFIDAEIMLMVRKLKLKYEEIPVVFSANSSRRSFVKVGAIIEFMINMIKFKIKH